MNYCIFTYSEDAEMLSLCAARIHQLDTNARIYAINDAVSPIRKTIPGVHMLNSQHDRKGNLNGLQNLRAQLCVFQQLLAETKENYLIKIDSDTWVNDLTPFLATAPQEGKATPDYLACENWEALKPSGNIYRLSRWMVDKLVSMFNYRTTDNLWTNLYDYPEDQTIFRMACFTGLKLELIPYTSGYSVGMKDGGIGTNEACLKAGIVHCGEPDKYGKRVSREHAALRMRLLKYETQQHETKKQNNHN